MADVTINGVPLATISAYVYDTPDIRGTVAVKAQQTGVYGRAGAVLTAPEVGPRTFSLKGRVVTTANTVAARATAEHVLRDLVSNGGLLTIEVDEGTTPVLAIDALLTSLTITPIGHPLLAVASEWSMALTAPDAFWRDRDGVTVVGAPATATRYSLPLGTAPSTPILRVMGSATNPVVTFRDSGGTAQVTLTFTVTLTSNEYLDVDCERGVLTKYSSGTASNGISLLTSGTFPFRLDPAWGDYGNSRWPTYETSAGQAEMFYVKRYA